MLSFLWETNENVGTTTRTHDLRNQVLSEPRSNHAIKNHLSYISKVKDRWKIESGTEEVSKGPRKLVLLSFVVFKTIGAQLFKQRLACF